MPKHHSRSPIKKLRLRRNVETPGRVTYQIVQSPTMNAVTVTDEPETSETLKSSNESELSQRTTSKNVENVPPSGIKSKVNHRQTVRKNVSMHGKVGIDYESIVQRFARFGLEKELSESSSDESSNEPVKKPFTKVKTKELISDDTLGNSESSEPKKKVLKKKFTHVKKSAAAKGPSPRNIETNAQFSKDTVTRFELSEPVVISKTVPKKRASRVRKDQKQRAKLPIDVEMRPKSPDLAMKSTIDELLPSMSVLQNMTPGEWIPRAVSEPREKPLKTAKVSSPLNLSCAYVADNVENDKLQSPLKLADEPQVTPISPNAVFSFAQLGATHNAPSRLSLKAADLKATYQSQLYPPAESMQSLSLDILKQNVNSKTIPLNLETTKLNLGDKQKKTMTKDALHVSDCPNTSEPNEKPTPIPMDTNEIPKPSSSTQEINENLPPQPKPQVNKNESPQARQSRPRLNAYRKFDQNKLKELATKCDQNNPGPPKVCPSGMGRIRLEPLSKTHAPVVIEIQSDRFQHLMPKLPNVTLPAKE